MVETISAVFEDMILYNGKSFNIIIFLAALIFLWVTEKNKGIRMALVYLTTAAVVIFICPVYAGIGMKIDQQIYYRVFWALPMGMIVCYSAIKVIMRFKTMAGKAVVFCVMLALIAVNGKSVYTNTIHFRASNEYHLPPQIIDIAQALKLDKCKPVAVLPAELLTFFRQYTADVYTPYGRNLVEPTWSYFYYNELYNAMEGDPEEYDAKKIAACAKKEHCTYVVLSCAKQLKGSMEEENYFLLDFVQGYYIYMDYDYFEYYKEQDLLDADVIEKEKAASEAARK